MDISKNEWWIIPFKKLNRLRVKITAITALDGYTVFDVKLIFERYILNYLFT